MAPAFETCNLPSKQFQPEIIHPAWEEEPKASVVPEGQLESGRDWGGEAGRATSPVSGTGQARAGRRRGTNQPSFYILCQTHLPHGSWEHVLSLLRNLPWLPLTPENLQAEGSRDDGKGILGLLSPNPSV